MEGKGKFPWMIWKYHPPSPVTWKMWKRMKKRRNQDLNPYQHHHTKTQTAGKKFPKPSPLETENQNHGHTDTHIMCYVKMLCFEL
jgi:hypothetical protein